MPNSWPQTHALAASGAYTWAEWSDHFAEALRSADEAGAPRDGSTYYDIWLSAFEEFLVARKLAEPEGLSALRQAWTEAYLTTPHGSPVAFALKGNGGRHIADPRSIEAICDLSRAQPGSPESRCRRRS